jgi:hypothetical protein
MRSVVLKTQGRGCRNSNPNSERKAEVRNPKGQNRSSGHLRSCTPGAVSGRFGFRISDFGFLSDFDSASARDRAPHLTPDQASGPLLWS